MCFLYCLFSLFGDWFFGFVNVFFEGRYLIGLFVCCVELSGSLGFDFEIVC